MSLTDRRADVETCDSTVYTPTLAVPELPGDASTLAVALAFAEAGFYVVPVARGSKNAGSVVGKGWQHQSTRDRETIVALWAGTSHGIALHCGRSGVIVADVDHPEEIPDVLAARLGTTPFQSTRPDMPGRGHYLFAMPAGRMLGNGTGRLGGVWGEIRGANGIIVVAPSLHPDGGEYRWVRTGVVPALPDDIADMLPDGTASKDAVSDARARAFIAECTDNGRPNALAALVDSYQKKLAARESRHDSLTWPLAAAMREAKAGLYPARSVVDTFAPLFISAATSNFGDGRRTRSERSARAEFLDMVNWAIGQADALTDEEQDGVRARVNDKIGGTPVGLRLTKTEPDIQTGTISKDHHLGQVKMAYRLERTYRDKLLHVHGIGWFRWDGTRWAYDDCGHAWRAVLDVLGAALKESLGDKQLRQDVGRCESASGIAGILEIASALDGFAATVRDIDRDPHEINCANGILDLHSLELCAHDPARRATKVTRGGFERDAIGPNWDSFIMQVLPDEQVRAYLQRLVGVSLLGRVTEHKLPILTGTGRNGKGTFYKAISWALGDYSLTAVADLFMSNPNAHTTGQLDLMGKRFVVISESAEGARLDEAKMKRLTGGDTIRARRMRQDNIEFEPSHQAFFITNFLPNVRGDDPATWARLRVIPFDVVIPDDEQDVNLEIKLQAEADAILGWAVDGWVDYQHRGGLDEPPQVRGATNAFHTSSDAVGRFVAERCVTSTPNRKTTTSVLYEAWQLWAAEDGAEPMSQKTFGQALDRRGYPVSQRDKNGRWRSGIDLKDEFDNLGDRG